MGELDETPGTSREERLRWIDRLRPRWDEAVRPFDPELEYPWTLPRLLEPRHTARCRVLPHRELMVAECLPKDGMVAEVGSFRGHFARVILEAARPRELHLIDMSFDRLEREPLAAAIDEGRVILHEGDSAEALEALQPEAFDWIYIDANHSYRGVARDIAAAKDKVAPDGYLVFNDYTFWSPAELMPYGVIHAVNELCLDEGWEMAFFAFESQMYCDVALRRSPPGT